MPTTIHTLVTKIVEQRKLKLLNQIAEGGMADIFAAYDSLGRNVVVRRLKRELRFKFRLRGRFTNGIRVRRKLGKHGNIVLYFGHGGLLQPYEVIQQVRGESLKTLIVRKHDLVKNQPLSLLQQAADALVHVHTRGFLHLDIKPENYLVEFKRDRGVVMLSDFDLCQPLDTKVAPKHFGGSLMYAPPEYLRDKQISVQMDYFAFGVLTYNLFTYQMPFVQSVNSIMKSKKYEIHFPDGQCQRLTPPIRDFISRCLAERPEYRFRHDMDFLEALDKMEQKHQELVEKDKSS